MMEIKSEMTAAEKKSLVRKMIIRFTLFPPVIGCLLFLPAGTFNFPEAWIMLAILILPMIGVLVYFFKKDPRFLERRTHMKESSLLQKVIQILSFPGFIGGFIVSGLDYRFDWSRVPFAFSVMAFILIILGYIIVFLVFRQNSFASRVIEISENQQVISTGLYGIIRHPMYLGVLLLYLTMPIALGSWWGLLPFVSIPIVLVFRILDEEKFLVKNLAGYEEYRKKVRYRLIPFVW
jgi:protein-S-isoprenylcysteine O-methyltransferase Ste14